MVLAVPFQLIWNIFHSEAGTPMATRKTGEKRKQRWVGATDSEWSEISEGAQAAGLSNSDYVIQCCIDARARAEPTDIGLPPPVLHRAVRAVLILEELQRLRHENAGETGEAVWRKSIAKVEAWITGEGGLG